MGDYLQESEDTLFVLTVHITVFKELEVWDKSFAWTDIPANVHEDVSQKQTDHMKDARFI